MATKYRGEKNVHTAWLSSIPLAALPQTLESHDKNNIPHLSDSFQGIPVKQRHFSVCILHCIETIWRNVWMWILLQTRTEKETVFVHVWRFALSSFYQTLYMCVFICCCETLLLSVFRRLIWDTQSHSHENKDEKPKMHVHTCGAKTNSKCIYFIVGKILLDFCNVLLIREDV